MKSSVTVAELATTQPINSMIMNGQLQTSVNGINIQNGLATQINAKVDKLVNTVCPKCSQKMSLYFLDF